MPSLPKRALLSSPSRGERALSALDQHKSWALLLSARGKEEAEAQICVTGSVQALDGPSRCYALRKMRSRIIRCVGEDQNQRVDVTRNVSALLCPVGVIRL